MVAPLLPLRAWLPRRRQGTFKAIVAVSLTWRPCLVESAAAMGRLFSRLGVEIGIPSPAPGPGAPSRSSRGSSSVTLGSAPWMTMWRSLCRAGSSHPAAGSAARSVAKPVAAHSVPAVKSLRRRSVDAGPAADVPSPIHGDPAADAAPPQVGSRPSSSGGRGSAGKAPHSSTGGADPRLSRRGAATRGLLARAGGSTRDRSETAAARDSPPSSVSKNDAVRVGSSSSVPKPILTASFFAMAAASERPERRVILLADCLDAGRLSEASAGSSAGFPRAQDPPSSEQRQCAQAALGSRARCVCV